MTNKKEFMTITAMTLHDMWTEQADFNLHFRQLPALTFAARTRETKEITLHLISECASLLDASGTWKEHRRDPTARENPVRVKIELTDILKYWITLCQIHGFTPEDMMDAFWEKSMVVRQRYSQEFVQALDTPSVVLDLDNVLADYVTGFLTWMHANHFISDAVFKRSITAKRYVDQYALNLPFQLYEEAKHLFRVSDEHARLPVMPGAVEFVKTVADQGLVVIILTSRPIDKYPNLFGETLRWLTEHEIPHHMVWWATDKGHAINAANVTPYIRFAVDDEERFVRQFGKLEIPTYWLTQETQSYASMRSVTPVATLAQILEHERTRHGQQ